MDTFKEYLDRAPSRLELLMAVGFSTVFLVAIEILTEYINGLS